MNMAIQDYIILFLLYSFIGWSIEVIRGLIRNKKFVNRGFLIEPYCPIYGVGCLMIIILLSRYEKQPVVLFILTLFLCSILEYFTSYIMEKLFNTRWWDYSDRKYNINGRICLGTLIPFGICGIAIVYILNPSFIFVLNRIPDTIKLWIAIPLLILFIIDCISSFKIVNSLKGAIKTESKDATEEINKKVKETIARKNRRYKRLLESFPYIKFLK